MTEGESDPADDKARPSGRGAVMVASGILLSRIFGVVRQMLQARYLGLQSEAADAFTLALRLPNFLQNLLGEGVLSASFIPSYTSLLTAGDRERARKLAGAVFSLLSMVMAVFVLIGIIFAPQIVGFFASNSPEGVKALTTKLVRIVFPGTGILVLSAWCLAVLNSHKRFLLSYSAPVLWNVAIITFIMLGAARTDSQETIVMWAAWGAVLGSLLQFLVQLPSVLILTKGIAWRVGGASADVKHVFRRFFPAVTARGSVQLSGYLDTFLVGKLSSVGIVCADFGFAQTLYQLPISLFGMAISAAELPEISAAAGGDVVRDSAGAQELRRRLGAAMRRTLFFVLPSAVALSLVGDRIVSLLFLHGKFLMEDVIATWVILAGFSIGVIPGTLGRLVATSFFAMHDTTTPLRYAVVRIVTGASLSILLLFVVPQFLDPAFFAGREVWRVAGLSIGGSIAFWLEFALLRAAFERKLGRPDHLRGHLSKLLVSVAAAAAVGLALRFSFYDLTSKLGNLVVIGGFGVTYLAMTFVLRVSELSTVGKLVRRS